ncbi:uncharacterized protein LOC119103912 isoform X2 [Pollicipes pollicipes]|uniref:uncharacterized protein LOC119103912 isoform X2 n=1 Tax=Pollicipes pollicipes TaxID=41117 RepID=UPI00188567B1|nr:uncharacterized protein LOC119103912 isoform X2 [Pollicipes pollicipes]
MAVAGPDRSIYAAVTHCAGRVYDARVLRTSGLVEMYNQAHSRTRVVVENAFGVMKRCFPAPEMGLRTRDPKRSLRVIRACIILHSVGQMAGDFGEWLGGEGTRETAVGGDDQVAAFDEGGAAERRAEQERRNAVIWYAK